MTICKEYCTYVADGGFALVQQFTMKPPGPVSMKTHLRRFRFDRQELSQAQIAEKVSVTRQTIIAIERGDYSPSVKLALQLARALDTTVEQLFELEAQDVA